MDRTATSPPPMPRPGSPPDRKANPMTPMLDDLSLGMALALFGGCALVIGVVGTRLTGIVDDLADRTGLGEAIA